MYILHFQYMGILAERGKGINWPIVEHVEGGHPDLSSTNQPHPPPQPPHTHTLTSDMISQHSLILNGPFVLRCTFL